MLSAALSLAVTVFVLIAVPGPSNLYIVGQTLASGRRAAFFSVIGNAVGFAAIGAAVVLVLGELLQRTDWLQTALVLVGVTVLAILAAAYLREARREWSGEEQDQETVMVSTSFRRAFFSGLVVGVTNPKGPILFGTAPSCPDFCLRMWRRTQHLSGWRCSRWRSVRSWILSGWSVLWRHVAGLCGRPGASPSSRLWAG
ncbi:LysE family translocator [Corynebacterium glyciniphilum]|uniref:LysE family translocator n=1 Tax=Corynebacterium glyciniphilum TaxID=1404244 RepID=UPI0011AB64B1|nr:LysE family translocator [Corynebacterium glyciniphilum]